MRSRRTRELIQREYFEVSRLTRDGNLGINESARPEVI